MKAKSQAVCETCMPNFGSLPGLLSRNPWFACSPQTLFLMFVLQSP
jgi:hypothetical protein